MTGDIVVGEDNLGRCGWGAHPPEYRDYHDHEWGIPVVDDQRIFEKLCLEGFQSGLSWLTILRKREGFREAFDRFDPEIVARYDERDIERLLANPAIVRHRGKIQATIDNARATLRLVDAGRTLSELLWTFQPAATGVPEVLSDVPAVTSESKALSNQLRRLGFKFVGPTTAYSAMQSLGVVNDHLVGCDFRKRSGSSASTTGDRP